MEKGISIIIPAWMSHGFLSKCLDSIAAQGYFSLNENYEILLGIDACQRTRKRALELAGNYRNMRVFWFGERCGPYLIRNSLSLVAKFQGLLFFDADDVADPSMIELIAYHKERSGKDVIYMLYTPRGKSVRKQRTCGVFFIKKNVFNEVGGLLPWMCAADAEFAVRLTRLGVPVMCIPDKPLVIRRQHLDQLTLHPETGHGSELRNGYIAQMRALAEKEVVKPAFASVACERIY